MKEHRSRRSTVVIATLTMALGGMVAGASPAGASECDKTPVHKLYCQLVDEDTIDRAKEALCAASSELCL